MSDVREKVANQIAFVAREYLKVPTDSLLAVLASDATDAILALLHALPEEPSEEAVTQEVMDEFFDHWPSQECITGEREPTLPEDIDLHIFRRCFAAALRAAYAAERGVTSRYSGNREGGE